MIYKHMKTCLLLGILAVVGVIASSGLISLLYQEVWDGGFPSVEFQFRFVDVNEVPIRGVELRVLTKDGDEAFGYPVTDYLSDSVPMSDENGLLSFHHLSVGVEFSGRRRHLFFLIPVETGNGIPRYTVQFLFDSTVITSYPYHKLHPHDLASLPTVNRDVSHLGKSPSSLPDHLRIERARLPAKIKYRIVTKTIVVPNHN
jgi:hypothetical protein